MRIPQVTGRIRADRVAGAPAQALRAAFTQVGRLLLAADELRTRIREEQAKIRAEPPPAAGPKVTRPSAGPPGQAGRE
jgi:hypothetical protein